MPKVQNVNQIFDMIHQDVIGRKIDYPHRMIRENYKVQKFIAKDKDEADKILTNYYQYHEAAWLRVNTIKPFEIAYSNMVDVLNNDQGGYIGAIKNCTKGREGGLLERIDFIAEDFRRKGVEGYVGMIVGRHCNPLDFKYRVMLAGQYIRQYGNPVLPGEDLLSVYELANHIESIIKYHANLVCSFRKLLQ